jgi:serine/threonine protein kinase
MHGHYLVDMRTEATIFDTLRIAPENCRGGAYDPRSFDVWAMGIIYMAMRTGRLLWGAALKNQDGNYTRYLVDRKFSSGFQPIERLPNVGQNPSSIVLLKQC